VIYILLDNASKYATTGTTISVRVAAGPERQVQLSVTDEGPGIPLEFRDRVFEKFFRIPARASHDPRRVGVGLGLPIAKRLIEAQGGQIWIETPVSSRGTAIVMTLPASIETTEADRPAPVAMAAK
jgi:signal transduction histidine kinase